MMTKEELNDAVRAIIGGSLKDLSTEQIKRLLTVSHSVMERCCTELVLYRDEDAPFRPSMLFEMQVMENIERMRSEAQDEAA